MAKAWERLGRFFRAEGQRPWMATHTQMPHAEAVEGTLIRIYFSSRDAQNRTHISWLILDLAQPDRIVELADQPLLAPGEIGLFDDMGVMSSWMTLEEGRRHFYTIGWNVKNRVPMHTSIGLAQAPADGKPLIDRRLAGPVFERNPANPYYVSCPCVLKIGDEWRMWFMNGLPWGLRGDAPCSRYDVGHARSADGVRWEPDGRTTIGLEHPDELAIARPCVVRDEGLWRMWHCYRGESFDYRIGYAESEDGETWRRRDDHLVILPESDGFDGRMTCYPYVFDHGGERWMIYCGDGFGQGGLGLARLGERGMSAVDVERFKRDGYLVLKQQIPLPALTDCLEQIYAVFNRMAARWGLAVPAAFDLPSLTAVMATLFQRDMASYLAAAKLAQHTTALHALGCDEAVLAPLRALGLDLPAISTRPVLFIIHEALKVPGGYHKSPPHQDWRSVQGSLDSSVVWIPYAAVAPGGHALEVLPGSHRRGLLPTEEDAFGHRIVADLPDDAFVPLQVELGDAVAFSAFLVHRTGEAGGPVARLAASYRYNNVLEPSFAERGYPNPYLYRPDLTLLTPDFPEPERLDALFGPGKRTAAE